MHSQRTIEMFGYEYVDHLGSGKFGVASVVRKDVEDFTAKTVNPELTEKPEIDELGIYFSADEKRRHIEHERDVLERIDGIDGTPRFRGYFFEKGSRFRKWWNHRKGLDFLPSDHTLLLKQYIDGRAMDEWELVEETSQQIALEETVRSIHDAGVTGLDIHHENIIISNSGQPFLVDFGFSYLWKDTRSLRFARSASNDLKRMEEMMYPV
jgi:predicted Ser/Thr protein kinase